MDYLDFSEEEILERLAVLGYKNIPINILRQIKQDLDELIRRGEWKSVASSAQRINGTSQTATSHPSPPAFTKEKVSPCYFTGSGEGFFLHAGQVDNDRQATRDSDAQHSVALNLRLPPGAPSRLQVDKEEEEEEEQDPDDTLHPPLSDSYASTPDTHRGRFIKRKVLRKHKGQSLVCDESFYSEDSEHLEDEEVEVEQVIGKEDKAKPSDDTERVIGEEEELKPVGDAEDSHPKVSEEDNEQEIGEEASKSVGDAEDSYQEASEENNERENEEEDSEDSYQEASEEDNEQVTGEEESKPAVDSQDSYQEASEEDNERVSDEEDSKSVGDSEDSYQETSENEEEDNELANNEEDSKSSCQEASEEEENSKEESKPVGDAEDSHPETSEEKERLHDEEDSQSVTDSKDPGQEGEERGEEESKRVAHSQDSYQEASEEETKGIEESKPVGNSEDSYQEASEEEESGKEESKPVGDAEDSHPEASEEEEEDNERLHEEEDSQSVSDSQDSDQETSEEEKRGKEESKPVGDSQDSYQEASEEEESSKEESKPVGDSQDSYQEASEEEESSKEESKPVGDAKDFDPEASMEEIGEEESKLDGHLKDSYQEASEEEEGDNEVVKKEEYTKPEDSHQEEKAELKNQVNLSGKGLEGGSDEDDEESCSSDSPVPSLMTSGYGTYRPEEGADYRDDHTITEFDQDSRGDLSEMRDDEEDDRSLYSFGGFDMEARERDYGDARPMSALVDAEPDANVACCGDTKVDVSDMKTEEYKDQQDAKKCKDDLRAEFGNEVVNATSQEQQCAPFKHKFDGKHLEDDVEGRNESERLDRKEAEDKVDSEDPDESSNSDIKFIDSKVDFSQMTFDEMCAEWEGNLRPNKGAASCLEKRLADLHLSSSAQRDLETENEDVSGQSDTRSSETEGGSLSAFESYMRGMTRSQRDGDLGPKPKSFIRPVMSQQTIKKTDPVAKYFQYKQFWEMFKLPGENDRRGLRLEIKERLAYQPPAPKPRRVYVPNTYIVPTEKKRSALRWEIRNSLANGLLPHKYTY